MFCPRCGTENSSQQRYCRRCGLPLSGARPSLEGQGDEALSNLKTGMDMLSRAMMVVLIFIPLLLLAMLALGTLNMRIFAVSMTIVFCVTVPFIIYSFLRFRRADRLLNLSNDSPRLPEPIPIAGELTPSKETVHMSEGTTVKLKQPSQRDR